MIRLIRLARHCPVLASRLRLPASPAMPGADAHPSSSTVSAARPSRLDTDVVAPASDAGHHTADAQG